MLLQIGNRSLQDFDAFAEFANGLVAIGTQQAPNFPCLVIMIDL